MLRIWGSEATQAIQFFQSTHPACTGPGGAKTPCADNSIPLVAGKQLVLRLYISGATPGSHVSAVVTHPDPSPGWFGSGFRVAGMAGMPGTASAATRTNGASTIQVLLGPYQPFTYRFDVIVIEYDPTWRVSATAVSSLTLRFTERRRIRIRLVRINYKGRMMDVAAPSVKDFWDATGFAQRALPIPSPGFEIVRDSVEVYDGDFMRIDPSAHDSMWMGFAGNQGTTGSLLNILDRLVASESLPNDVVYVAIYPDNVRQSAFAGWSVSRWIISDRVGETFAHEIVHKFGSPEHAPCGGPANVDAAYPDYPSFSSLPAASIGEVGFDLSGMRVVDPQTTFDLMSYCSPKWISPYNYLRCFNTVTPLPPPPPPPAHFDRPDEFVHVGVVRFPDRWTIVDIPGFARPIPPRPWSDPGEIRAVVLDRSGRALGAANFRLSLSEVPHDTAEFYDAEVPYHPDGASIDVVRGDKRLATFPAQAAPKLDVTFPSRELDKREGALHYRVEGGERVSVAVRTSADAGVTWTGIVLRERSATVDLHPLLAALTGDECFVEVRASSGYHTTTMRSAPFRLRPRERPILAWSGTAGSRVQSGLPVTLMAVADDGVADASMLQWFSDIDGDLGVGACLITTTLTPGRHRIEVRSGSPLLRPGHVELDVE
jgi:hypothetical protein